MDSNQHPLHVVIFPFLAQGHIIPTIDLSKLFASHGAKVTVLTTKGNLSSFQSPLTRANELSAFLHPIQISLIPFPSVSGLPDNCENMAAVPNHLKSIFFEAMALLQQPFFDFLKQTNPDCVVAGLFLSWIHNVASELNIPSLDFHGSNFTSKCMLHTVERHNLLGRSPTETVLLPDLPHRIEMRQALIPDFRKLAPYVFDLLLKQKEAEKLSHGLIVNSFYELEPGYVDYFRNVMGKKAWHVGPLLLNDKNVNTFDRGSKSAIDEASCLSWLGNKSAGSVLYVCFGSASFFTTRQLREIAEGLEGSGHAFVWVVRDHADDQWMPEGYEERIEGRGLIIKGWAPQMMILNHEAVGGYLTHCGWNSSLEGISVGLPFATWPLFAEQTYNERLIVDVLKIGVEVGVKEYSFDPEQRTVIEAGSIESAVKKLMGDDEEAEERRRRAKELAAMAKKAVEEGGSSYESMRGLIRELEGTRDRRRNG